MEREGVFSEQPGIVALPKPEVAYRAGSVEDKLVKEAKINPSQEQLDIVHLGDKDFPNRLKWSWLGLVLRMPEHRLVRQVLLNCVRPTHETLFADVLNLSIENATKMSKDRKLWSSNRPSLRWQPL